MQTPAATRARTPLDRFLSVFAEVKSGEGLMVVVLAANIFLVLLAYYLIKVLREPLILVGGGAELKSYSSAGQAVLLIFAVKAVDWLSARVGRLRLIAATYLFFASNLLVFYVLALADVPIGVAFYLWVGIFNVTAIAQFWSFANDVYDPEQGKRLFAIVGIGASAGAVAGSEIAGLLIGLSAGDGADSTALYRLMLYAAGILVLCLGLTWWVDRRTTSDPSAAPTTKTADPPTEAPIGGSTAFKLLRDNRYLALIALLILLLNWVNSTGEYILDRTIHEAATEGSLQAWSEAAPTLEAGRDAGAGSEAEFRSAWEKRFVGDFRARFFFWVNLLGVLIQLFLVSRVLKYAGVRIALYALPVVALLGYSALLVLPVLAVVRVAKIAENAIDYSLQNTTQQALWLVTTREAKYKAKTVIDTFVRRIGDVMQALVVWVGVSLGFGLRHFVLVALSLVVCWLLVVAAIARHHKRLSHEDEASPNEPIAA